MENLKKEINYMQKDIRKNNLILHGIEENENNDIDLLQLVLDNLNSICSKSSIEEWDKWEISKVQRLGKRAEGKIRPVLITLTLNWRKIQILKNKKHLPERISVMEDFPKEILTKRKELKIKLQEEIKKGNQAYIRYDQLIIKGKLNEKRKRQESNSPTQQAESSRTSIKINKTFRQDRPSSFHEKHLS